MMIRTRWCLAMNSLASGSRPGSGRPVDFAATNETVPKSDRRPVIVAKRIPLGTGKQTSCFTSQFDRAGIVTGKRQRILLGMLEAVGRQGYERTTVEDALTSAGLYRQAF